MARLVWGCLLWKFHGHMYVSGKCLGLSSSVCSFFALVKIKERIGVVACVIEIFFFLEWSVLISNDLLFTFITIIVECWFTNSHYEWWTWHDQKHQTKVWLQFLFSLYYQNFVPVFLWMCVTVHFIMVLPLMLSDS